MTVAGESALKSSRRGEGGVGCGLRCSGNLARHRLDRRDLAAHRCGAQTTAAQ
jgi:hypothetical protein